MEEDAMRSLVRRLSRPHASGGAVVEHAALMAAGADSTAVLAWIAARDGRPEALPETPARRGLHGSRLDHGGPAGDSTPRRYILPPGALS